jgi:predicted nucleic acid-binding protein
MGATDWITLLDMERPPRIYADTSVFGGCFDTGFEHESRRFFELVESGRVVLLVSAVTFNELRKAPTCVREVLDDLPDAAIVEVLVTADVRQLAADYVKSGVVGGSSGNDALHVAAATAARADAIVSWNFRDIVRFDRIRGFNVVNLTRGFGLVTILSPRGVSDAA